MTPDGRFLSADQLSYTLERRCNASSMDQCRDAMLIMDCLPKLSEKSILDRSKADSIAKTLLLIQAAWFCWNCVGRLAQSLPLSLLEVSTVAHVLCTFATYMFWWSKPLNIGEPIVFDVPQDSSHFDIFLVDSHQQLNLEYNPWRIAVKSASLFAIILCIVYSAPHIAAWNSDFPTTVEREMWRSCSLIVCGSGLTASFILYGEQWAGDAMAPGRSQERKRAKAFNKWATVVSAALYVPSSLFLVMEGFRQLSYLPSAALQTPVWADYIPHLS